MTTTEPLSAREAEVASYIARGWRNKQIATEMDISVHTVRSFTRTAMRAWNCVSRTELALKWREHSGYVTPVVEALRILETAELRRLDETSVDARPFRSGVLVGIRKAIDVLENGAGK